MDAERTEQSNLERRLAAIVVADIAGYSRMVADDEAGTIARMRELRDSVTEPAIRAAGGRVVKRTGDGTLVEFASIHAAAEGAVNVQRRLAEIAALDPEERRFVLRIGLHLGEILVEPDGDIHGDGVNVAARLEALCAPGEILVSGEAWAHLDGHIEVSTEALGPRELKNIPRKIDLHRLIPVQGPTPVAPAPDPGKASHPLAERPSIVVLPFDDMSANPDDGFLADGLVEDVITALSRFRSLFVIGRNTAFTYRNRAINIRHVGRELGVQYVLEGSVRRVGDRIRVTAQLIDATADRHIWAEKYDRRADDVFALQDELTEVIVHAVAPEIESAEVERLRLPPNRDLKSWEVVAQATRLIFEFNEDALARSREILAAALEDSPGQPQFLGAYAMAHLMEGIYGWSRPVPESFKLAIDLAQSAVAIDGKDDRALAILATALHFTVQNDKAIPVFEAALEINPNNALALGNLGIALLYEHDPRAPVLLEKAIRQSPRDLWSIGWLATRGFIEFLDHRFEEALPWGERSLRGNPRFPSALRLMACTYGMLGRLEEARGIMDRILEIMPGVTLEQTRASVPIIFDADMELFLEGLRRAGMSEG